MSSMIFQDERFDSLSEYQQKTGFLAPGFANSFPQPFGRTRVENRIFQGISKQESFPAQFIDANACRNGLSKNPFIFGIYKQFDCGKER